MGDVELDAPPTLDELDQQASRFKRMIAVAVVLVTLFGATVAYFQAVESNDEDIAARDAQRDAVAGLGSQVDASAALAADLRIASDVDVQLQRQALNAARVNAVGGDPDSDVHLAAAQRFAAVSEAIAALTPIDPADQLSIDNDIALRNESPDAARLRQAVEADRANDHGSKADSYVAVLTVLAVALFLLGLSLTVQGRSRFVLAAPGAFIAIVCVAWSFTIARRDVAEVSERAVQLAAEGLRLQDAGDIEAAIDAFDAAIDDSPDFAAAHARRAAARFLAGSPQAGQTAFVSITSEDALDDALEDIQTALDLGADSDVVTVAEAGFNNFLDGEFARSVELSTDALELNENLPQVWFNLGVAELAQDHEDEADDAYRQGLRVLERVPDPDTQSFVLAGARTDLSILRELLDDDDLDDVADLIEATEVRLAEFELETAVCPDGELCAEVDDVDEVELGDAEFSRTGSFVEAVVPVEGLEAGDAVGAVWYFRTDDAFPFAQAFLSFDAQQVGTDGAIFTNTLPSISPACPVAGDYLVRFYAGGEFLGEVQGSLEPTAVGDEFTAFADRIEGIEACVPEGFLTERADISELDAFTTFGGPGLDFLIGVNVTPGAEIEGDPQVALREAIATVATSEPVAVRLHGRDLDGNFVFLDGLLAVDEAEGVAVAVAVGPDTSSRTILITGTPGVVNEALLLDVIGLITFTGVGTGGG